MIKNKSDLMAKRRIGLVKRVNNKKGQMAIWIIIATAIIGTTALFFILRGNIAPDIIPGMEESPKEYLMSCAREETERIIDIILPRGGFIEPGHAKLINDINVSYLCYNAGKIRLD